MSRVVAISGSIASGKTTLSVGIAAALGWRRASFGDYIRHLAAIDGRDPVDTGLLQDLGESLVRRDARDFCVKFLRYIAWQPEESLVLDGLRHQTIANVLRHLVAPATFAIIFVNTNRDTRSRRLRARSPLNNNLDILDVHAVEAEVPQLLSTNADLVVDGTRDSDELVEQVMYWVRITGTSAAAENR